MEIRPLDYLPDNQATAARATTMIVVVTPNQKNDRDGQENDEEGNDDDVQNTVEMQDILPAEIIFATTCTTTTTRFHAPGGKPSTNQ